MHQDPEHEDYDDDEYNYYPSYNDHGYPKQFNIDFSAWETWLSKVIKEITEEDNVWMFGHKYIDSDKSKKDHAAKSKYFVYLGNNTDNEGVWKKKYFVSDKLEQKYRQHLESNAVHFLRQPNYYRGLFDNLN